MFKEVRKRHGLTQAELAALLGLSANRVARIERGERGTGKATLRLLERIDRELSVSKSTGGASSAPRGARE